MLAELSVLDLKSLLIHLHGFRKLPLRLQHTANVDLCRSCEQVVAAEVLLLDAGRALPHVKSDCMIPPLCVHDSHSVEVLLA